MQHVGDLAVVRRSHPVGEVAGVRVGVDGDHPVAPEHREDAAQRQRHRRLADAALAAHDHHTARALDRGPEPALELGAPPLLGTGAGVHRVPAGPVDEIAPSTARHRRPAGEHVLVGEVGGGGGPRAGTAAIAAATSGASPALPRARPTRPLRPPRPPPARRSPADGTGRGRAGAAERPASRTAPRSRGAGSGSGRWRAPTTPSSRSRARARRARTRPDGLRRPMRADARISGSVQSIQPTTKARTGTTTSTQPVTSRRAAGFRSRTRGSGGLPRSQAAEDRPDPREEVGHARQVARARSSRRSGRRG